jgi:hypothetical protein
MRERLQQSNRKNEGSGRHFPPVFGCCDARLEIRENLAFYPCVCFHKTWHTRFAGREMRLIHRFDLPIKYS